MPGVVLIAPAGTGKTELARSVAGYTGNFSKNARPTNFHMILAGRGCVGPLHEALTSANECDVLFVDEVHALDRDAAELLYPAIETFETVAMGQDGRLDRGHLQPIAPISVILATNCPGAMPAGLRSRVIPLTLDPYSVDELRVIAQRVGKECGLKLTPQAARVVAERSSGTPRHVEQMMRVLASVRDGRMTQAQVEASLHELLGLDGNGLSHLQRIVLGALAVAPRGTLTAERVVQTVGLDARFVRNDIEDPLQRRGFLEIDAGRTRHITDAGRRAIAQGVAYAGSGSEAVP
jgi:Holliday junction DNA helicase RuvB